MEPLSPRAANIQIKPKAAGKPVVKTAITKKPPTKDDHAPKPPPVVVQPPLDTTSQPEQYKTGNHLGRGGFAICYEGELQCKSNVKSGRIYALKIVPSQMNSQKMEDKFRTELQIHAKLRHPNIVEFHRAFTFKESTYIVLELCGSGSVMDLVRKRGSLSLPEVRRLTVQLCGAVKYMHARNVIHRDLKMGNLFLDHDMNLKIGDFGLAAVLVSKTEYEGLYIKGASRRTTMCGTPNYIAPEILEKSKGGHDHKVDIWAVGVILFAMLTGFPPFASQSSDEIYRKAKILEYDWPVNGGSSGRCHNDIPSEVKDLVACLLRVDAETRPNPDEIVGHKFFSMRGGNAIPLALDPSCRRQKPSWLLDRRPLGDVMDDISPRLDLSTLAKQCGVGRLGGIFSRCNVVGDNVDISLYKECMEEERQGKSPIVPVPEDMVYCSTTSLKSWPNQPQSKPDLPVSATSTTNETSMKTSHILVQDENQPPQLAKAFQVVQPVLRRRGPIQSHAATLRAADIGPRAARTASRPTQDLRNPQNDSLRGDSARRLLTELPVRPGSSSGNTLGASGTAPQKKSSRVTRSATSNSQLPQPSAADQLNESEAPEADKQRREQTARNEARIAANVQEEMKKAVLGQRGSRRQKRGVPEARAAKSTKESSLIGPDEVPESLQGTDPEHVLASLECLRDNLVASLNGSSRIQRDQTSLITAGLASAKKRPVVQKWVDYADKFGIGYAFEDGTIGSIFNGRNGKLPSYIAVPNAEGHFARRKLMSYSERNQVVHKDGGPIAFYEDCGKDGLRRVLVSPKKYQTRGDRFLAQEFKQGTDKYDSEKRQMLYLWEKFAVYIRDHLGNSDIQELEPEPNPREPVGPFVRFYQRVGNVGIWGFGDGSFQFNFPDHTKLIVSPDGTWLEYCYLPIEAARVLKQGSILEAALLLGRGTLSYPSSIMMKGSYKNHDFRTLIFENELHAKVAFVKDIVSTWVKAGGLGRMGGKKDLKWGGMTEKAGKYVWVTIGAYGGDEKKSERRAS